MSHCSFNWQGLITMYYAIAVGREQVITESWKECQRLTRGYSGARFKRFHTMEEAQEYIERISIETENKTIFEFEVEQLMLPSFINGDRSIKTSKTEVYIASDFREMTQKVYLKEIEEVVDTVTVESTTVSCLVSTIGRMKLPRDHTPALRSGDSRLKNYLTQTVETLHLDSDKQRMYLTTLTDVLKEVHKQGVEAVNLLTDSNYLTLIIKDNIFSNVNLIGGEIHNRKYIEELYEICNKFEYIFVSYYSGNLIPNKLKYVIEKSKETNTNEIQKQLVRGG